MSTKKRSLGIVLLTVICGMIILSSANAFAATAGDVNNDGNPDLKDVIMSLQISADLTPKSYVYKKCDINGDGRIGLEEAVYDLQVVASLREKATVWYKDADGDKYSDGTTQISVTKPSAIYFDESELTATSGDANDNDPNIHPDATPKWVPFDITDPANPTDSVDVNLPVSTTQEIVVEYSVPGMKTTDTPEDGQIWQLLNIPGCGYTTEVGKPRLPVVSRYVAIPAGAIITKQITDSVFRDITGYSVYPAQPPQADTDDVPVPPFTSDAVTYQTDDFYPSDIVQIEGPVIIRGVSTIILRIHPVQFNPVKKTLRVYSSLKIKLTFSGGTRAVRDQRLRSPSFDQILGRLVLNNNLLSSGKDTRAAYDNGNSLLIITHPNFLDAANTLKNWKIRKGIYTEVRTTNETGSTASAIQNFIKTAYDTWTVPPTYVLLIGDAEFIPTNYVTVHPEHGTHTGTDIYYSTVDGDDYFPDINIGRLSVDTLAQANKRVNDIISYEKGVVTDSNYYKKAVLAAYFQHSSNGYDSRRFVQTAEDVAIFLSDPQYLGKYLIDRIYYTESSITPLYWSQSWFGGGPAGNPGDPIPSYLKKPGFAWNGNRNALDAAINDGRFLVIHRDHGGTWGWGYPTYITDYVQALTNGNKLPVVWSINCLTGWFDNETDEETYTTPDSVHFSETWERNPNGGAVGVIGATRVSYTPLNDYLLWGWADAIWPDFERYYSPSGTPFDKPVYEMGPVLNYGKYYLALRYGDNLYTKTEFEEFHWFGDPTMQIWTDVPQTPTVSHPSALSSGATSVDVSVSQTDTVICVSKNGAILSRKLSAGGITTLSWSAPLVQGDVIYITVTKHNFRPYEGSSSCSSCSYSINPTSNSFASSGGTGSVSVTAASGCAWTAVSSNTDWLTITSGPSGNGNGSVNYSVAQNTGGPRTGTLTIAGQTFTVTQSGAVVNFPDKNLESAVRQAISKPSGDIFVSDLSGLTSLYANGKNIANIEGLQYCTNLNELALESNQISDISALAGLTNLTELYLIENQISNISALAGLTKLTILTLWGNRISSINALAGLTNLTDLYLDNNQISNISALAGLTKLSLLILSSNQISDISALAGLTNLSLLWLSGNQISNISVLAGLTKLDSLWLSGNQISDISPLVSNSGINSGDDVDLTDNPLNATSCTVYIPQLQSRDATVRYNCSCTYSINPASNTVASTSSTGSISITSLSGCNWTATSNATWITITSGNSGTGNGTVNYSVAQNTGGSRTGIISVAGQTFTVTQGHNPSYLIVPVEYGTIQAAIDAASDGMTVWVADGTYKGIGNKDLDFKGKKITLRSENGPATTIIDCENNGRGFYFHSGETSASVVSGFTIKNGNLVKQSGAGIYCENSSPIISNCVITNCQVSVDFSVTSVGGAGIYAKSSNITITGTNIVNCSVNGSSSNCGGAGMYFVNLNGGNITATITNCLISNNQSVNNVGGGIYSYGYSLTIDRCNITDNSAWYDGGLSIRGNSVSDINFLITDTNILRNTAKAAGGIRVDYFAKSTMERCNISQNVATRDEGGGITVNSGSSLTLKNCVISQNTAVSGGGGLVCYYDTTLTVINSIIGNNNSTSQGGGIRCPILISGPSPNCIPNITNSIIWGNTPDQIYLGNIDSSPVVSYSDIQGGGYSGAGNINADPLFVGNGDYHLTASSPCVNTGTSGSSIPTTDIEGKARPQGSGYDMGAYER